MRAAASCRRVRLAGGHLLFFFFSLLVFSPLMCKQRENVTSNELGICCAHANLGLANCKQSNILWLSLSTHSLPFGEHEETPTESRGQGLVEAARVPRRAAGSPGRPGGRPQAKVHALMHAGSRGPRPPATLSHNHQSAHVY